LRHVLDEVSEGDERGAEPCNVLHDELGDGVGDSDAQAPEPVDDAADVHGAHALGVKVGETAHVVEALMPRLDGRRVRVWVWV